MAFPIPARSHQATSPRKPPARFRRAFVEQLEDRSLLAVVPQLVADINATPATVALDSFNPSQSVDVGGIAYFSDRVNAGGTSGLWRSDGSAAGTHLVKNIRVDFASPQIANLTNVGGKLFFSANDGTHGVELWKSDGTEAGTKLVKDIVPGLNSATLTSFVDVNGTLFFVADDGTSGPELWKSDGTEAGTMLVKDIVSGLDSSNPEYLTSVNNTLFFSANDGISGAELWKSDGTPEGTVLAADISPGPDSSNPRFLTNVNGTLFFPATDDVHGRELWKFDAAVGVASLVRDIKDGAANSNPSRLSAVNGALFFYSSGLWKSDGTSDGTVLIKTAVDINMSAVVGNTLYFWTLNLVLWKSDGTPEGTQLVDNSRFFVTGVASVNDTLYYATNVSATGGDKLWKIDPSQNAPAVVRVIDRGSLGTNYPSVLSNIGGKLFFSASDGAGQAVLWASDGTAAGTAPVPSGVGLTASGISFQGVVVGDALYTSANDGVRGTELWRSDGTSSGTSLVKDIISPVGGSRPSGFINLNGTLLFIAYPSPNSSRSLLRSDGTAAGTTVISAAYDCLQNVSGTVFFQSSNAVWKTDGTNAGTVKVISASPTNSCSSTTAGGLYYYTAYTASDSIGSRELWRSDGTPAGTFILKTGLGGLINSFRGVAAIGPTLFFEADDGTNGTELWKTDGTVAGTTLVKDIRPGPSGSGPTNLVNSNGTLYFFAKNEAGVWGLWKSDGTSVGTVFLKDVNLLRVRPPIC